MASNLQLESWRIFRIMAEFIDGFETLKDIPPSVAVFGSARTKKSHPDYRLAEQVGKHLVKNGFGVITGGGPGAMEAANRGAARADGISIGLNITLPHEQGTNPFVKTAVHFRYFFVRKVMFVKNACAIICMPGGFGTMDEFFESLTLIQTGKVKKVPMVLVGHDFWDSLVRWMKRSLLKKGMINAADLDLFVVVDTAEEAVAHVVDYYKKNPHEDRYPI